MAQAPADNQDRASRNHRRDVLSLEEGRKTELSVLNEPDKPVVPAPSSIPIPAAPELEEDFPEDYPDYFPTDFADYLVSTSATVLLKQREDTRGRLAIIYTVATFLMFLLGFLVAVLDGVINKVSIADNLSKILPLLSGIFLGTLGFVLGYYFRQIEDENSSQAPATTRTGLPPTTTV